LNLMNDLPAFWARNLPSDGESMTSLKPRDDELDMLSNAFGQFNRAASVLGEYYEKLSAEMANFNHRIEEKNRQLERSLVEQENAQNFLTHLLDNLSTGVLVFDPDGRITLANQSAMKLLGIDTLPTVDQENDSVPLLPAAFGNLLREARDLAGGRKLVVHQGPNGRLLSYSLSAFDWPGEPLTRGVIVLLEDVTSHAHIGAQRERAQTLTAMGEMAAEIAHQLRNPLGGIELFASILYREVEGDESLSRLVDNLRGGVKQVSHLITNYLTLADLPRPVMAPVIIDDLRGEALNASAPFLERSGIDIHVRGVGGQNVVEGDRELLLQVFLSLILNAVEAMPDGGRLTIDVESTRRRMNISFMDTGCGIPAENVSRIFNPFFTTKNKSLGLGLAVSHRIIDAHNGLIQVESQAGRGTTVRLTLPLLAVPATRTTTH
jgi:signal transduction histidine kinase